MLDDVKDLEDSLSMAQLAELQIALGDELFQLLNLIFESESDGDLDIRVQDFAAIAKKNVFRLIRARKVLDGEQSAVVTAFIIKD